MAVALCVVDTSLPHHPSRKLRQEECRWKTDGRCRFVQRISQGCCSVVLAVCHGDADGRQSTSNIKAPPSQARRRVCKRLWTKTLRRPGRLRRTASASPCITATRPTRLKKPHACAGTSGTDCKSFPWQILLSLLSYKQKPSDESWDLAPPPLLQRMIRTWLLKLHRSARS